jgi:hypothetical protein
LRVYGDGSRRGADDGYSCELASGIRSSEDARRLAFEIAFSTGRLLALAIEPPGLYGEAQRLAAGNELEAATWVCFVLSYVSTQEGEDAFAGARAFLDRFPRLGALAGVQAPDAAAEDLPIAAAKDLPIAAAKDLPIDTAELGPRSSHVPGAGLETIRAYARWADAAGSQRAAFGGDPAWSAERRFERVFERLGLLGLARWARYELMVTLGRLGAYQLRPTSLQLAAAGRRAGAMAAGGSMAAGHAGGDAALTAAKRLFGIADARLLEQRAGALALACGVPVEALELALFNWAAPVRATMGAPAECADGETQARVCQALGLDVSAIAPS